LINALALVYYLFSATTKEENQNVDEERIVRDGVHFVFDDVFFFVLVVGKKRIRLCLEEERPQQQKRRRRGGAKKKHRGGLLGEEEELSTPRRGLVFSKRRARTPRERDVVIARR
jgi:hypothetical protein